MTRRARSKEPIVLIAFVVLFVLGQLAFALAAQAGRVHFDPESPAGKEYALPLSQARHEALGGGGAESGDSEGAGAGAPLFGVGISGGRARQRVDSEGSGPAGAQRAPAGIPSRQHATRTGSPHSAEALLPTSTHDYPSELLVLLLAGILLLGVALGLGVRARAQTAAK